MKSLVALQIVLLVSSVSISCGKRPHIQSSLREIASSANGALLDELEKKRELSLNKVIEKRAMYGLSEQELADLKENFSAKDLDKLVLSLVDPKHLRGLTPVRWAYLPNVSDSDKVLKKIETVDKKGQIDVIDGTSSLDAINAPVITLSFSEKLDLPAPKNFEIVRDESPTPASEGSLMLENIQFKDTSEPWIKGEAEIYAVVSYIDKNNTGATEILELPSVDYSNQDYPVRIVSHMWIKNRYQILNITFFEHDSNHSYSELAKAFAVAAAAITQATIDPTKITTLAVMAIVGKLSTAMIDALPKEAFTDEDDYLDSVNSVEKYQAGIRVGARSNVSVKLSHFVLKLNDE